MCHGKISGNEDIYFYPVWINHISASPNNFQLAGRMKNRCSFYHVRMCYTNLSWLAENTYLEGMLGLSWYNGEKRKIHSHIKKVIENQDISDSSKQ